MCVSCSTGLMPSSNSTLMFGVEEGTCSILFRYFSCKMDKFFISLVLILFHASQLKRTVGMNMELYRRMRVLICCTPIVTSVTSEKQFTIHLVPLVPLSAIVSHIVPDELTTSPRYLTFLSFPICFPFISRFGTKLQFIASIKHFVGLCGRFFFSEKHFILSWDDRTSITSLFMFIMSSTKARVLMVVFPITAPTRTTFFTEFCN